MKKPRPNQLQVGQLVEWLQPHAKAKPFVIQGRVLRVGRTIRLQIVAVSRSAPKDAPKVGAPMSVRPSDFLPTARIVPEGKPSGSIQAKPVKPRGQLAARFNAAKVPKPTARPLTRIKGDFNNARH